MPLYAPTFTLRVMAATKPSGNEEGDQGDEKEENKILEGIHSKTVSHISKLTAVVTE
jgi:hypothetical protein